MGWGARAVFVLAALLLTITGCGDVDFPELPNLAPLNEVYENPTGTVDPENVDIAIQETADDIVILQALGDLSFVIDSLTGVEETLDDYAEPDGDPVFEENPSFKGFARVKTICPGWGAPSIDAEENGTLDYTVEFTDLKIEANSAGGFEACRAEAEGIRVQLDTSLGIYIPGGVRFDAPNFSPVLFALSGPVRIESEEPIKIELDFRVTREDLLEVRTPVSDGDVIVSVEIPVLYIRVRGSNGTFCCDALGDDCFESSTGTCS